MLKEIYPYLLVALIGSFGHILKELARLEKITETFRFKIWIRKNKFTTTYGLALTIITIIVLWSLKELNWASAILAGYAGDSILKTKLPQMKDSEEEQPDFQK